MAGKRLRPNQAAAVRHPQHGGFVVPNPAETYSADDPLVRQYPWLFSTEDELAARDAAPAPDVIPVEQATRAPGEKRTTRRQR